MREQPLACEGPGPYRARETLLAINRGFSLVSRPRPDIIRALELAFHFFVHSGAAVIGAIGIHIYCALELARGRFASGGLRPWRTPQSATTETAPVCQPTRMGRNAIEFNKSACSDNRRFRGNLFVRAGRRRNNRGATGLHRRRLPGLLGCDSRPQSGLSLSAEQQKSPQSGLSRRYGSISASAPDNEIDQKHPHRMNSAG